MRPRVFDQFALFGRIIWAAGFDQLALFGRVTLSSGSPPVAGGQRQVRQATRDDYTPFFSFAHATGLRLNECLLRWSEVHWEARQIRRNGKGGKLVTAPITSEVRAILWPLRGHHPELVFTFVAARTLKGRGLIKGERYPITYQGVKTAWRRLRAAAWVVGFRFHDFRHNLGTKLLRETGNLKLVQRALNHSDLKTTARYAHVLDQDVAEALEQFAKSPSGSPRRDRKTA